MSPNITTSSFLKEKYFLIIELPFNIRLIYYQSFSHLDDAERIQESMPYYKIVTSTSLDKWDGKSLIVPLKKNKAKATYTVAIQGELAVEAASPDDAHRKVMSRLHTAGIQTVKTLIIRKRELTKL